MKKKLMLLFRRFVPSKRNINPRVPGFAEIVSDYFPILRAKA